jgi:type I restriction enzyme S subunit
MNVSREGRIDLNEVKYVAADVNERRLRAGDVLFNNTNSPELVGKTAVFSHVGEFAFSNHMTRVRLHPCVNAVFLANQLHYRWLAGDLRRLIANHVNQASISRSKLSTEVALTLPPTAEQERIVAAIEEAFSKLDAGEAGLRAVRQRLQRMRESVRTAATTGWPAEPLVEVVGANSITDGPFGSNLKTAHYTASGPRVIRLQNIGDGAFRDERAHISAEHYATLTKHSVEPGDVLVASLGEVLPRACLAPTDLGPAIVKADCIRIRPSERASGAWLVNALNSRVVREHAANQIKGVGRPRMNLRDLRDLPVPIPPIDEQSRIVAVVERQFSFIEACEKAADEGLAKSAGLRRSVLKAAFEGKLVPQDPSDEPASVLLERIRKERAEAG